MESPLDSLRRLIRSTPKLSALPVSGPSDECAIEEVADTYGFSLVRTEDSRTTNAGSSSSRKKVTILEAFRSDGNWNNPASVSLMSRAYGITDEYGCFLLPAMPELADECNYITIKEEQNSMFAQRRFADGMLHKSKGNIADGIKSLSEAVYFDKAYTAAYLERAQLFVQIGKQMEAINDYKTVLQQLPGHMQAIEQYTSLCRLQGLPSKHYGGKPGLPSHEYDFGGSDFTSKESTSINVNNRSFASKAEAAVGSNSGLISKLQHAIRKDTTKLLDESSSNSSSDSSSSSDSESASSREDRVKKRKHRERKEHKDHKERRSREARSAKKRKSKHKKDKHHKHKKRKRDANDSNE